MTPMATAVFSPRFWECHFSQHRCFSRHRRGQMDADSGIHISQWRLHCARSRIYQKKVVRCSKLHVQNPRVLVGNRGKDCGQPRRIRSPACLIEDRKATLREQGRHSPEVSSSNPPPPHPSQFVYNGNEILAIVEWSPIIKIETNNSICCDRIVQLLTRDSRKGFDQIL